MLRLRFTSNGSDVKELDLDRFPVVFGRAKDADVRLDDKGIWDHHACLELRSDNAFYLKSEGKALTLVNDELIDETRIRPGARVQMGDCRFLVVFTPVEQRAVWTSELLVLCCSCLTVLAQFVLIYFLLS